MSDILEETLVAGAVEKVCKDLKMSGDDIDAHVSYFKSAIKGPPKLRKESDVIHVGDILVHAQIMNKNSTPKIISDRQMSLMQKAVSALL